MTTGKYIRHYYLKSRNFGINGTYDGCVCLMKNADGKFFRGISLCNNEKDHFMKLRARGLSYSRALAAMEMYNRNKDLFGNVDTKSSSKGPIGRFLIGKVFDIEQAYGLNLVNSDRMLELVQSNVELTDFEKQMCSDIL